MTSLNQLRFSVLLTLIGLLFNGITNLKAQSRYQFAYSDVNSNTPSLNYVRDLEQEPVSGDLFILSWDEFEDISV